MIKLKIHKYKHDLKMASFKDKWVRRFIINETTRHRRGFTIYKVTSMVFLKSSPDTASRISVWKRYNDFRKLHSDLKTLHGTLRIKEPYPAFPKPKFFGRFEAEVIEKRRECAVQFLQFIARHPSLFTNDIFVAFFETSLGDDNTVDCSRSLSSDTSEDDKSTMPENSYDIFNATGQRVDGTKDSPSNDTGRRTERNILNDRVEPILSSHLLDSSIDERLDERYGMFDNNNVDKNDADLRWIDFVSYERPIENGTSDTTMDISTTIRGESDFFDTGQDSGQYVLIAAAHMSAGFRHEAIAEYEEAFMQYKLGISNLRQGVQNDRNIARVATIEDKIVKYSERADRLYNRHLNCNISTLSKPASELQRYKVLKVIGSVMLVEDIHQKTKLVIKTVEKPAGMQEDISKYILRGRVPYMVQLHACVQTETTVFLILQYASGGKLWDFLKARYAIPRGKVSCRKKNHRRSSSCEAMIQINSERRVNTSLDRLNGQGKEADEVGVTPASDAKERREEAKSLRTSGEESLRISEEHFDTSSISDRDISTTALLEKALQLLKSVDATIKKSNSIATRLNESGRLLCETKATNGTKDTDESEITEGSGDSSELSITDSCADLSTGSDRAHDTVENDQRIPVTSKSSEIHAVQRKSAGTSETIDRSSFKESCNDRSLCHDEDSGIEMEQELWRIPETTIESFAAQILLTIESLHQQQVIMYDLKPDNLLVDENGRNLLTYVVPRQRHELSRHEKPYAAPELCTYLPAVPATTAVDVWSFGVILYELLTGIPFQSQHRMPFHSHSIISIPNDLSHNAKLLLTKILRFEPSERLTIPEIKRLPFFEKIDWLGLLNA